jgi:hypothetical protein
MITDSDHNKDWWQVGWKGIMLFKGDVWLNIDDTLLSVNYKSDTQKQEENR